MFTTPKNIIITLFCFIMATVAITKAMTPAPVILTPAQTNILTITDEIKKNSDKWKAADEANKTHQKAADEAQSLADEQDKARLQAEADNIRLRQSLEKATRGETVHNVTGTPDVVTEGKNQPTE